MKRLFTERYGASRPRTEEVLSDDCRTGLLSLVASRIDEHWFGDSFPHECEDGYGNAGTDHDKLRARMKAFDVIWPADWTGSGSPPTDGQVFDLLEFTYEHVAQPERGGSHSYWGHSHYSYDQATGRTAFTDEVNRIFARHGMAFDLRDGQVERLAPTGLQESLAAAVFHTGDDVLDDLLETARHKFLHRDLAVRREALEKLWDAWERLKTLEHGKDKKAKTIALLRRAAPDDPLFDRLESEARELTEIGNRFMIRHTETDKTPITDSLHIDYLYQRMFAMIRLLLRATRRGG